MLADHFLTGQRVGDVDIDQPMHGYIMGGGTMPTNANAAASAA